MPSEPPAWSEVGASGSDCLRPQTPLELFQISHS